MEIPLSVFSVLARGQVRCVLAGGLATVLLEVDLFLKEPLPFEELYRDAVMMSEEGTEIRVASVKHLIELKRIAGRPRDLEDIAALEIILAGKEQMTEDPKPWPKGWDEHRRAQIIRWAQETAPAQRLRWLEGMLVFLEESGRGFNRSKRKFIRGGRT